MKKWTTAPCNSYQAQHSERIVPMPYYIQHSGSCWAAAATELVKSYRGPSAAGKPKEAEIYQFLYWFLRDNDEFGSSPDKFGLPPDEVNKLAEKLEYLTDVKTNTFTGIDTPEVGSTLLMQLDRGVPVMLNAPWRKERPKDPQGYHSVLVIGYRKALDASGNATYDFLLHDTSGPSKTHGGMNWWRSWEWLKTLPAAAGPVADYHLVWFDTPPLPDRPLQTIGLPHSVPTSSYHILFRSPGRSIRFAWRPDELHAEGCIWYLQSGKTVRTVDAVPLGFQWFELKLPLCNADPVKSADVGVMVSIAQEGNPHVMRWGENDPLITLGPSQVFPYELKIPVTGFQRMDGSRKYTLGVELHDSRRMLLDRFSVGFVMDHLTIASLQPSCGRAGDEIVIRGGSFGARRKTKESHGDVLFNDIPANIVRWSDTEITVKTPLATVSGPVSVRMTFDPGASTQFDVVSNAVSFEVLEDDRIWDLLRRTVCFEVFVGGAIRYKLAAAAGESVITGLTGIQPDGSKKADGYVSFIPDDKTTMEWQGRTFRLENIYRHNDGRIGWKATASGELDLSGRVLIHAEVCQEFPVQQSTIRLKVKNLPLDRFASVPCPTLSYEVSGADVGSHISEIYSLSKRHSTDSQGNDYLAETRTFDSADWNDPAGQPYLQAVFYQYYNDKRREFTMFTKDAK